MKTIINEDLFLNRKIYKKIKLENIKIEKRKINIIKFPISILMIFLVIKISILIKRKEDEIKINYIKKRRESIVRKQIRPYSYKEKKETIRRAYSIDRDLNEEYKDIQEYINMTLNGTLYNPKEVFKKIENPKISIVITVYNGEGYLKTSLLSIQNQDFKDIEIIMVDDCSKDNSVNLIKELMIKDPRIKLYQNKKNKGMLYTKTRGVLNSKGKYVMILDVDDIYAQRDAFSTLYIEAEKNNLDILGYSSVFSGFHIKKGNKILKHRKTEIIYKPNIIKTMYKCNSHECIRIGGLTSQYFIRTDLFVNIIKQIDDKYMNVKMNFYDDFLMFFLLARKAHSLRQIKRILYIIVRWPKERNNTLIQFRLNEKKKNRENMLCSAYINYIEFVLMKSNNDIYEKKIPSFELKKHFLKHQCRYNKKIRKRALKVLKLFLRNNYIKKEIKNEILVFLNETRQNIRKNSMK
jgi:glycosyltransferase involved in cell wall biosynthesis